MVQTEVRGNYIIWTAAQDKCIGLTVVKDNCSVRTASRDNCVVLAEA